jgi:hypothetical protein
MHLTGSLPKKYTAQDLASFVDFRGTPRRLINAMNEAGFLSYKKGRGFYYPEWKDTVTGDFAAQKEDQRLRKVKERAERKKGPPLVSGQAPDVLGTSRDASLDQPRASDGHPEERNQGSISDRPPEPPHAGGDLADARWEWLSQHAPTPQNRDGCKKLLAVMSESDWVLVTRAYSLAFEGASISPKDLRVLKWPTDRFLRQQAYLRFGVSDRPRRRARSGSLAAPPLSPADELKQRLLHIDSFVTDLLGDPDQSESAKADAKRRWEESPENADRTPPWSAPRVNASLNGTGR